MMAEPRRFEERLQLLPRIEPLDRAVDEGGILPVVRAPLLAVRRIDSRPLLSLRLLHRGHVCNVEVDHLLHLAAVHPHAIRRLADRLLFLLRDDSVRRVELVFLGGVRLPPRLVILLPILLRGIGGGSAERLPDEFLRLDEGLRQFGDRLEPGQGRVGLQVVGEPRLPIRRLHPDQVLHERRDVVVRRDVLAPSDVFRERCQNFLR